MRKFFALLLALCLLFTLAACKSSPAPSTDPGTSETDSQTPDGESSDSQTPDTDPAGSDTTTPDTPDTDDPSQGGIRGVITDSVYENKMLNLRIKLPSGWIFYNDEQIAEVNNITADMLSGTDAADFIGKNGQLMDMMITDVKGNNANLIIQPKPEGLDRYTDEQIFTLSEESFKSYLSDAGMDLTVYEPLTMNVGGQDRSVLHMILSINGTEIEEYQLRYRNDSDYMGILTVAIQDGSDVQPILDGFTAIN